jgi:recombination protein RecA
MRYKEGPSKLQDVLADFNKENGANSVSYADDNPELGIEVWDTGSFSLNHILGNGGIAKGRVYEVFGAYSCLAGETQVHYMLRGEDGNRINEKGGEMENLYRRFHGIRVKAAGEQFLTKKKADFFIQAVDENNHIFFNPIVDVVKCGVKECFTLETMSGRKLICTKDHKFLTENNEFKSLKDLFAGDIVFVHSKTRDNQGQKERVHSESVCVKYHPFGGRKYVTDSVRGYKYRYDRVPKSHLVYEAWMNGLDYDEYIRMLNSENPTSIRRRFKFIPKGHHIHHIDKNHHNNKIENLQLVTPEEHGKIHYAEDKGKKFGFKVTEDKIRSISYFGETETYDVKCLAPHNNYLAEEIVVHNSGKTTACLYLIAQIQKQGGKAAFIDAEFSMNLDHARKLGVDTKSLLLSQPPDGETAFSLMEKLIHSGEVAIIVVDSTAALVPSKELEGDITDSNVALQARMISKGLRMLTGAVAKTKTIVIFISQVRSKIGSFHGPTSESSGGNALKFYTSVRLEVHKVKAIKEKDEKVIGNRLKIVAVKNKVAAPFGEAEVDLYFESGFDLHGEALDYGEEIGLVKRTGITYTLDGEKIGSGRDNAKLYLMSHEDLYEKLKKGIQAAERPKDGPEDGPPEGKKKPTRAKEGGAKEGTV